MPLWLTEFDLRHVLPMPELIDAMEAALAAFSAGRVVQPLRSVLELGELAFFASMPAWLKEPPALGAKLVSVVPANAEKGLPTHLATVLLFDVETGALRAVMDGRYITEVRTAAVSAVSVRHLARRDAAVLAILGSGVQARSHAAALHFREARAWSPTRAHLERFAEEAGVHAAASAEEAVRGADVVLLATSSIAPAIDNAWVKAGAHVIAVGACRPNQRELDPALVARAALFVDSRQAALAESGDVIPFGAGHIRAELGEVVSGTRPGRTSVDEVTLFKSLGLAVEDVAAAQLAWRRARELNLGSEL